ncbi:MAG: protein-export membrane protein SecF [Candidatus Zambryskibacteria bacterium RIFOXYD1_FULL_40_13]|nr:MAG: Protein translocase subunit SecF [Parcubacteria group bacterium GW2011_GWC1_39_12]KKR18951.1 MAG: Protein translocase subunit SecF [Parcubacteria group bacterium GW2011_GWF1_39_37]KKR35494.1 MAG: Protein translocase subunit SecF [Parcubacteria group bacterium GW2011_GWC2_40_10]KKR51983.1 MAG: Protein translocase subunit SecF [Parcubacteria group bacterium GW2011_GWE1_40_20]KKR68484.1 MAG: Protein translocase subunit SecF [Parcubacteria group bacterium GW2011_GWF2_40_69]KKR81698.1 MAG: 
MFVVNYRKLFFTLSILLVVGSFVAISVYGLNFGIDFKGGSILEVSYPDSRPEAESIKVGLNNLDLGSYILTPFGEKNFILRAREITPVEKTAIINTFSSNSTVQITEERFNSIGPAVGTELKNKAILAIILVVICIVLFITFAFRKVSHPVASWKYGLATIIALVHDIIIPTGIFVIWAHYRGGEIDMLFITALLAILGYSVHDTIVVFDRVRENLRLGGNSKTKESFIETVGTSVSQTFARSINTSLTIFLALVALYFFGGEATRNFAFILLVGIIAGTYSSIFVASPLLVTFERFRKK